LRTDHKPYLIQIASIMERIRNNQMPDMDGIKGAEIQSDFHGLLG
jgi:hypothetical protein